jgi:hypothetical protein
LGVGNWMGSGTVESHTAPVLWLRDTATRLGLLARDPAEHDAAIILFMITAANERCDTDQQPWWQAREAERSLIAEPLGLAGWRRSDGDPVRADDVGYLVSDDRQVLDLCAGGIDLPLFERRSEPFRTRAQLFARLALVS